MVYSVTADSFTKISETSGTIQNADRTVTVEISNNNSVDTGILIGPGEKITFSNKDIYLRCVRNGETAQVRVVPFSVDVKGGGTSSAIGSDSDAFKAVSFVDNTLKFYTSTDTDTAQAAASIDIPAEQFLDAASTSFVPNFIFSAILYEGATNPNLDGKPVLVLAIKTKNNDGILFDVSYKFLDLSSLLDSYINSDTSVVISDYKVKVNISSDNGNFLSLKSNGLYVDGMTDTATTLSAGLMSAADKLKLNNIEDSAQVNVIESVKVNNTALAISNKAVNIDLANASVKSAASLNSAKSLKVSLASSNAQSFNGSDNATVIGVGGILPVANGGTGNSLGSAAKLNTAQNFITNLNSTIAGSFNGTASVSAGVTGTLPVTNGGTGQSDLNNVTVGGAVHDNAGNVITDTYVTKTEFTRGTAKVWRFGYRIKNSEADPYERVEYLYDAVGMTPAHMVYDADSDTAGTSSDTSYLDYGSWRDVWFVRDNKPCMLKSNGTVDYYLDPNDYSKKENGDTDTDIANTDYDGNAMAQFPLCWVKRYTEGDYVYEIVSNVQYDEDYKAYAHTDAAGNIKDYFFVGIYGISGSTSRARSLSNQAHIKWNFSHYFSACRGNGSGWSMIPWAQSELIRTLLTLMGKSCNIVEPFGTYRVPATDDFSETHELGNGNQRGQFFGFSSEPTEKLSAKKFHIEISDRFYQTAGFLRYTNGFYAKMTPPYSYSSTSGYTFLSSSYPTGQNYVKTMHGNEFGLYPTALGASSSTYYCAYMNFAQYTSYGVLARGSIFNSFIVHRSATAETSYYWGSLLTYV